MVKTADRLDDDETATTLDASLWLLDVLAGTPGDDLLTGTRGPDQIRGGGGDDTIRGGGGSDRLLGNAGNDTLVGNAGSDRLAGGIGDDTLVGSGGRDRLAGGRGDDTLSGNGGRDVLSGGADGDELDGGRGPDVLTGGAGTDRFLVTDLDGTVDRITDYDPTAEVIDLSGLLPSDAGFSLDGFVRLTPTAEGTVLAIDLAGAGADFVSAVLIVGQQIDDLDAEQLGLNDVRPPPPPPPPGPSAAGDELASLLVSAPPAD